jgi:hypothetical protein
MRAARTPRNQRLAGASRRPEHDAGSAGSKASASARVTAVTVFTHRIWPAVTGSASPAKDCQQDHAGFAAVGRQHEQQRFLDVVEDHAAFAHGARDGREIVVGQHQVGRFAGGIGPLEAHRHADVGGFQRRRVVDPVASHCHQFALGLQRAYQAQLVLRAGTGKDVGARGRGAAAPRRRARRSCHRSGHDPHSTRVAGRWPLR